MDITKLTAFCTIVDCGTLSKAAEILYCSQPALSKQLTALEKEFGCPLFDREKKRLVLNKSGKLVYEFGRQVEKDLSQLKANLYNLNHPNSREIIFGATNYIGIYLLPPLLSRFKQQNANIATSFTVDFFPNIMDLLKKDLIGFALVPENDEVLADQDYVCTPFCKDEMAVFVPVLHPLAKYETIDPEQLSEYPFLISQVQSATRTFVLRRLSERNIRLDNMINMYNTEAIKQGLLNEMGISILSKKACSYEEHNGFLKSLSLDGVSLERTFYTVHKKKHILSREELLFINTADFG